MITIILTYRNRDLNIVRKCLESLLVQKNKNFKLFIVDYGSNDLYKSKLENLLEAYTFVKLIRCETTQQLWCKSRAINIVLKRCETPYFFVGDIDMVYQSDFIDTLESIKNEKQTTYFQVGFLSKKESQQEKPFDKYNINFKSKEGATGMTLYPTKLLKEINGYDEFYNGWGSEDTDVHIRLKNAGYTIKFYTKRILMLHQWHAKSYRAKNDVTPFHSSLEQVNAAYLNLVKTTKKVKANTIFNWGIYNHDDYKLLESIKETYSITNRVGELLAFISGVLLVRKNTVIKLEVNCHKDYKSAKQKTKALLGKKTLAFNNMQTINDSLLECIIRNLRNQPYQYQFDAVANKIKLTIKL